MNISARRGVLEESRKPSTNCITLQALMSWRAQHWYSGCHVIPLWFHTRCDSGAWWCLGTMGIDKQDPELGCVLLCSRAGHAVCWSHLKHPKVCSQLQCLPVLLEAVKMGSWSTKFYLLVGRMLDLYSWAHPSEEGFKQWSEMVYIC